MLKDDLHWNAKDHSSRQMVAACLAEHSSLLGAFLVCKAQTLAVGFTTRTIPDSMLQFSSIKS